MMPIYRVASDAPEKGAPVSHLGVRTPLDPARTWIINGVYYTQSEAARNWGIRKGWSVTEVPTIPPHYLEQCARLDKWPIHFANGGPTRDGANPESRYRYPAPGDTTVDVRHILDGTITA